LPNGLDELNCLHCLRLNYSVSPKKIHSFTISFSSSDFLSVNIELTGDILSMTAKKQQTVTAIYKKESGRLRNFLRRILPSAEDAEDILQDVFYSLSRQEALETIDQISGWLFRVARNKIADRYRKHKPITFLI